MAQRRVTGTEWGCDGCDVVEFIADPKPADKDPSDPSQRPENWIGGTAEFGPLSAEWVAHTHKCVNKAVSTALEAAAHEGSET